MHMKRIFTLLATALMAVLPLSATQADSQSDLAVNETKTFHLGGFDALSISWLYQVELTQASEHSVQVEAPDFVMPYLDVTVSDGTLRLGLKEMPKSLRRRVENGHVKVAATVTMPELSAVRMSGASQLEIRGSFPSRQSFELGLSGATKVEGLSIEASHIRIGTSGVAKFSLKGNYDRMDVHMSGSSAGTVTASAKEVSLGLSGSSNYFNEGTLGRVDIRASGVAHVDLEGAARELDIEGSGSINVNSAGAPSRTANVRLSGACHARIQVSEELGASLSGASSLNYRPGPDLRITYRSLSGSASMNAY